MLTVIIGAGPGGLVLAAVLHRHGIPALVLERDASRSARSQGGTLDLHPETGQWALEQAGLTAGFRAVARPEGQDLRIVEPDGTEVLRVDTPPDAPLSRPEIDRTDLRDLLLDALPPGAVRWDTALERAEPLGGGRHRLHLAGGDGGHTTTECDLLVGADGAWSRVRPLLTDARPAYTGVTALETGIAEVDRRRPRLAERVGRGSFWALGEGRSIAAQRTRDGHVRVGSSLSVPEGWASGDPAADRRRARALFDGWAPEILEIFDAGDDPVTTRRLSMLPVGLTWPATPGVTLLGDAAHLMPPVGLGANTAMRDGAELALALAADGGPTSSRIRDYEEDMFQRSAGAAGESVRISAVLQRGARPVAQVLGVSA